MRLSIPLRARIDPTLHKALYELHAAMKRALPAGASPPSMGEVVRLTLWAGVQVLRRTHGLDAPADEGRAS